MLVKLFTDKTVSETAAALRAAAQVYHFGVMQVHNLKETMSKKCVDFARECLLFEVCQPQFYLWRSLDGNTQRLRKQ